MSNITQHPVVKDFLYLTRYTTPHGWEGDLYGDLLTQYGARPDVLGNYFLTIPGSKALFACHMDTAGGYKEKNPQKIKRVWKKGGVLTTDGSTLLGADDKAGMAVLLHMIRAEVPGIYAFYVGEECGCVGSSYHAGRFSEYLPDLGVDGIEQVVSFDRYGKRSIITHQMGMCASDEYAKALAAAYRQAGVGTLAPDAHGIYTDSAQFTEVVSECTNVSVGYDGHHGTGERQDLPFLIAIAEASTKVAWSELPLVRVPGEDDYSDDFTWGRGYGGYSMSSGSYYKSYKTRSKLREEVEEDDDVEAWRKHAIVYPDLSDIIDPNKYFRFEELLEFVERNPDEAAMALEELRETLWRMTSDTHQPSLWEGGSDDERELALYGGSAYR